MQASIKKNSALLKSSRMFLPVIFNYSKKLLKKTNSPHPKTLLWEEIILSINVVPDRGMPIIKTGLHDL